MDLTQAHSLAVFLVAKHLPDQGWIVRWERNAQRAGACYYGKREIVLSENAIVNYSREDTEQVVIHEIAHAKTGAGHGHDNAWLYTARKLGYRGDAFAPDGVIDPSRSVLRMLFIFFAICLIIPTPITWAIAIVLSVVLLVGYFGYKATPVYSPDVDYFEETS